MLYKKIPDHLCVPTTTTAAGETVAVHPHGSGCRAQCSIGRVETDLCAAMEAQTVNPAAAALGAVRKWWFDCFKSLDDPDSPASFANGTRAHSFSVFLPACMEEEEEEEPVDGAFSFSFVFKQFLRRAAHDADLCNACNVLKLSPQQANQVPECHPCVRFFMHLKRALATAPPSSAGQSSAQDLGEPCDVSLTGQLSLPHISPPFIRAPNQYSDRYDKFWDGHEAELHQFTYWTSALLCAFPNSEIGLVVDCRVCGEKITLTNNMHNLDFDPKEGHSGDTPPALMAVLAKAECPLCGYVFSAFHPLAERGFSGISMRDD